MLLAVWSVAWFDILLGCGFVTGGCCAICEIGRQEVGELERVRAEMGGSHGVQSRSYVLYVRQAGRAFDVNVDAGLCVLDRMT